MQAIRLIHQTEGIRGFYWGVWPAVVQIMPYMGMVFMTYDGFATAFEKARVRMEGGIHKAGFTISAHFVHLVVGKQNSIGKTQTHP